MELYIGLMSGTSADGIDAALVDFTNNLPNLVATHYTPHPESTREKIFALCQPGDNEIQRLCELDLLLGEAFAATVNHLLQKASFASNAIIAIGSHGQTIRHHPHPPFPFTVQIGDPNTIAVKTGITTIADFRRKDVALGGQGAPLVPAFHQQVFTSEHMNRAIINIGGIANVTLLLQGKGLPVIGFDTGPGNALMDAWIQRHYPQETHDKLGAWGSQGHLNQALLSAMLIDPYFQLPSPKSTGREYFNLAWLDKHLSNHALSPVDVQTTLVELTAQSILQAVMTSTMTQGEILICGGGAHNQFLMNRLKDLAGPSFQIDTTSAYGIDPDWVEAVAFAWLARQTINRQGGNLPEVTGAKRIGILGGVYYAE